MASSIFRTSLTAALLALLLSASVDAFAQPMGGGFFGRGGFSSRGSTSSSSSSQGYANVGKVGEAYIEVDEETGSLIIITDDETNAQIQSVVQNLDRPVPQALIKVLFLEVTHSDDLDLGVEASYEFGRSNEQFLLDSQSDLVKDLLTENNLLTDGTAKAGNLNSVIDVITDQLGDTGADSIGTALGTSEITQGAFYKILDDDFSLTLRALAQVGKLEVLSRPSILARNNETAIITIGQEVPRITNSRITDEDTIVNTVEYEDIGIILEVTPRITQDNQVEMYVAPEISTMTGESVVLSQSAEMTVTAPVFAVRSAETSVVVPDGRTVVIGGLMEDQETETVRKVPLLGDIPVLGMLFRRTVTGKSKTELLIFLTPHVVRGSDQLRDLSVSENNRAELPRKAFTQEQLDKYIDNLED